MFTEKVLLPVCILLCALVANVIGGSSDYQSEEHPTPSSSPDNVVEGSDKSPGGCADCVDMADEYKQAGGSCADCPGWASQGFCTDDDHKAFMSTQCQKSCGCDTASLEKAGSEPALAPAPAQAADNSTHTNSSSGDYTLPKELRDQGSPNPNNATTAAATAGSVNPQKPLNDIINNAQNTLGSPSQEMLVAAGNATEAEWPAQHEVAPWERDKDDAPFTSSGIASSPQELLLAVQESSMKMPPPFPKGLASLRFAAQVTGIAATPAVDTVVSEEVDALWEEKTNNPKEAAGDLVQMADPDPNPNLVQMAAPNPNPNLVQMAARSCATRKLHQKQTCKKMKSAVKSKRERASAQEHCASAAKATFKACFKDWKTAQKVHFEAVDLTLTETEDASVITEKNAFDAKKEDEANKVAEELSAAEQKTDAQEKNAAEDTNAAKEKKAAQEKKASQEKKATEEKKAAEEKKADEEKNAVEQQKVHDERKIAEEKKELKVEMMQSYQQTSLLQAKRQETDKMSAQMARHERLRRLIALEQERVHQIEEQEEEVY